MNLKKTFWEQIQEKQEKYIQENLNEIAEEIKRKIFDDIEKEGEKMKMSKYKKGDKFIIEIEKVYRDWVKSIDEKEDFFKIKNLSAISLRECDFDKFDKLDETKTYEQGLADAWEVARKLVCEYSITQTREILQNTKISAAHNIFNNHTPAEAIAKIKEYEDKQKEIKVGDEVCRKDREDCKTVVTAITKDKELFDCISLQGVFYQFSKSDIKKTGRHFPQVEELLKAMKA